jgi:hypothetical protein
MRTAIEEGGQDAIGGSFPSCFFSYVAASNFDSELQEPGGNKVQPTTSGRGKVRMEKREEDKAGMVWRGEEANKRRGPGGMGWDGRSGVWAISPFCLVDRAISTAGW